MTLGPYTQEGGMCENGEEILGDLGVAPRSTHMGVWMGRAQGNRGIAPEHKPCRGGKRDETRNQVEGESKGGRKARKLIN